MAKVTGVRGYSDETGRERTGRTSEEWYAILDAFDVKTHGHAATARHLQQAYGLNGWWSQMVTVRYEYARGLRTDEISRPPELQAALEAEPALRAAFEALSPYQQGRTCVWIEEAVRPDTRARRLEQTLAALRGGRLPPGA
jgi:Bacteriocin-protection, YdeI or OmpD-Associated